MDQNASVFLQSCVNEATFLADLSTEDCLATGYMKNMEKTEVTGVDQQQVFDTGSVYII